MKRGCLCMMSLLFFYWPLTAQKNAVIREIKKDYVTYPFSDPNPIPSFGKIYPYFRFDGFTATPVHKKWKVVQLENDFIRIEVFPEIGGKVGSAYDKVHQRYFLYNNNVVKFRDIAMRGPWTSGGIEFNYGIIGHTPNTSTPVDYQLITNPEGSVSCIIGCLEMLTRTRWNVEIKLEKDKAFFTTRSCWFNATAAEQPYYQWSNSAVHARNDLQLVYPGAAAIGHSGEVIQWPYDSFHKKQVDQWKENNYGSSKSVHVINSSKPYFGAYWAASDFGMLHYNVGADKLGRKMFSWALSDQGDIWKELLTDADGQYVEMQSGRLFNQNSIPSSLTPFKQTQFVPYGTDQWTEYWFPFSGTGGVTDANEHGVIKIKDGELKISPLQYVKDTLFVKDSNGQIRYKELLELKPLETRTINTTMQAAVLSNATISLAKSTWNVKDQQIHRPLEAPADFDWEDAYGLYMYARDLTGLKNYPEAELKVRQSLQKNKNYIPALALLSHLQYNRMRYDSAFYFAKQALSVDAYDGAANYYYALAALKTGSTADAMDGLNVAVLTTPFRSAAYTEMSRVNFIQKNYAAAKQYAERALTNNWYNLEALQLQYLINRIGGIATQQTAERITAAEPLNRFLLFEKYLETPTLDAAARFKNGIQNEFPYQTYLELAIWYYQLGRIEEAEKLLLLAPRNSEILYWLAYINREHQGGMQYLEQALAADINFIFPFREESQAVFDWAITKTKSWKPVYLLALLNLSKDNKKEAGDLLQQVNEKISFAPFYIVRASLTADPTSQRNDLVLADKAGDGAWRYKNYLIRYYLSVKAYKSALQVAEPFYKKHPDNYINGMLYVRALMRNNLYEKANEVLQQLKILPFEGAGEGKRLYEETKLMLALEALGKQKYTQAQRYIDEAELWPRNMGAGKPFETLIDNRLEQFFKALILIKTGNEKKGTSLLEEVAGSDMDYNAPGTLTQVAALKQLERPQEATALFSKWSSDRQDQSVVDWGSGFLKVFPDTDKANIEKYKQLVKTITETEDKRLF